MSEPYDFAGEAERLIEEIDDTATLACTTPQELELLAVAEIAKAALRRAYEAGQASLCLCNCHEVGPACRDHEACVRKLLLDAEAFGRAEMREQAAKALCRHCRDGIELKSERVHFINPHTNVGRPQKCKAAAIRGLP